MGIVDVHVHLPTKPFAESFGHFGESMTKYFGKVEGEKSVESILEEFDKAGIDKMVILGWDAETATKLPRVPNEYISKLVDKYPDRFIGFAGIDPHKGKMAIKELRKSIRDLGLKGVKLHPNAQAFFPNDSAFNAIWDTCVELDVPVLFHMGMTAWGAGLRGGGGVKLKYSNPMCIDDIAADFPDLRILGAHPAWPWLDEMIAISLHKPNVYIDLSGWMPKYIPEILLKYVDTRLRSKCMFGSDYPFISPGKWLEDFRKLNLKPESYSMILEKNATTFLRL